MKTMAILFLACASLSLYANPVAMPRGRGNMVAESVAVRLLKTTAEVSGTFEFNSDYFSDRRTLFIPVFVAGNDTPVQVLAHTNMEVEVPGYPIQLPEPCPAPKGVALPAGLPRIVWFSTTFEFIVDDPPGVEFPTIHVRYSQALIDGTFYYLPIITGHDAKTSAQRDPNYQLHAQTAKRPVCVLSRGTDFTQSEEKVTVYLKDRELVILR